MNEVQIPEGLSYKYVLTYFQNFQYFDHTGYHKKVQTLDWPQNKRVLLNIRFSFAIDTKL